MKKILVTILLTLGVSASFLTQTEVITALSDQQNLGFDENVNTLQTGFKDIEAEAWFAPYIEEIADLGIVEGYSDGRFGAWDPVNRAELAKMLVLLRSEIKGNWFEKHLFELILVFGTLLGWISVLNAFRKSTDQLTEQLVIMHNAMKDDTTAKHSPSSEEEKEAPRMQKSSSSGITAQKKASEGLQKPSKEDRLPEAEQSIEKNLKSNWWV